MTCTRSTRGRPRDRQPCARRADPARHPRCAAEAGVTLDEIDAIAVGNRPGLIGALLVGVAAAKALAWSLGVPVVGVDHVVAHLYAPLRRRGETRGARSDVYPALGLVVTGGHTSMYRCESADADRGAWARRSTMPSARRTTRSRRSWALRTPAARRSTASPARATTRRTTSRSAAFEPDSLDFSFSGLKTAVLYAVRGVPRRPAQLTTPSRSSANRWT